MLRTLLFLFMGAGVLVFSFVAWLSLHPPAPPAQVVPKVVVLAAANVLRAGTLLKPDDIEPRELPESDAPAGARRDTPQARAELFGAMVRQTLLAHQVVLPADVMRPGDHGFLAAVLTPGKRATSVGVDAVSGTAGLIWPGDHVDVILTAVNDDATLPAARRASAETVLGDVRVIAIDQQLMQGASGSPTDQTTARTVTLEVTEVQAERVALAARLGHLSLIVRAADAAPDAPGDRPPTTWGGDVSPALNQGHAAGWVMRVYQGTADGKE